MGVTRQVTRSDFFCQNFQIFFTFFHFFIETGLIKPYPLGGGSLPSEQPSTPDTVEGALGCLSYPIYLVSLAVAVPGSGRINQSPNSIPISLATTRNADSLALFSMVANNEISPLGNERLMIFFMPSRVPWGAVEKNCRDSLVSMVFIFIFLCVVAASQPDLFYNRRLS